jgi:2-polyprenyl-6-methoxyphenol hydroxylase-like FAD-dependent oxidoreductase
MIYDFAILGGGAAGLSLALALMRSPLKDRSILIVEKDAKDKDPRSSRWKDLAIVGAHESVPFLCAIRRRYLRDCRG